LRIQVPAVGLEVEVLVVVEDDVELEEVVDVERLAGTELEEDDDVCVDVLTVRGGVELDETEVEVTTK
jgi:hypothetical protein